MLFVLFLVIGLSSIIALASEARRIFTAALTLLGFLAWKDEFVYFFIAKCLGMFLCFIFTPFYEVYMVSEIFDPNGSIFEIPYVFTNILESSSLILKILHSLSGVYMFKCLITGDCYVGSALQLGRRFSEHMHNKNSNPHLQNALLKYGISSFAFIVITFCEPSMLIMWEQLAMDLLNPRYNILLTAGSLLGFKWGEEMKAKVSGPNNHAYGKPSHKRKPIYCFDARTNQLVFAFQSVRAAAKSLHMCNNTIKKYIDTGI